MPVQVSDVKTLRLYVRAVMGKAKHHAPNVEEIILALAGAIITWKGSPHLEVRASPAGGMGNVLTFTSSRRKKYALSYNHATQMIELRKDSFKGAVLHTFDNRTKLSTVASVFSSL